ncbi:hypothetical protein E4H04_10445 [Candidatus Bathyarchaeota archaeon]|nr:MAG: hypothetical protein E4H04_10445 [Candidatus Bathyarchaeota archaeon]
MDKEKKYLSIVFVIGLIGVSNLAAGVLSSLYLSDMNLPERISAINSTIGSFDPKLVQTLDLQTSVSIIQDSVMEELTNLMSYSQMLNALPVYLIINGILFILLAAALYFLILDEYSLKETK